MILITKEDLDKYIKAQELEIWEHPIAKIKYAQNRYSYGRWKASGLDPEIYLYIADHEKELIKLMKNIKCNQCSFVYYSKENISGYYCKKAKKLVRKCNQYQLGMLSPRWCPLKK
ncbi:MAG: hypothetical protein ACLRT4_13760 [Thomasclavelia sp.]